MVQPGRRGGRRRIFSSAVEPAGSKRYERGEADRLIVAGQERNGVEGHLTTEERTLIRLATNN